MLNNNLKRKETCPHNVYIKGLCGNCGVRLDPPQSTSVSMIHSVPELKVSEEYAKEIGKADQERLIEERKLVLLVDLDQTILHTTHEEVKNDPNVHSFTLWPGHPTYFTKLRPHLKEFLDEMSKIYELHIFTFGCRKYAHQIASIIDPEQKYFGNRILSRDESVDQYSKKGNLNNLFPCGDAMVCIIDDRSDVWKDAGNLIQVKPYSYFKTSISDGAYKAAMSAEDDESLERDVDKLEALLGYDDDDDDDDDGDEGDDQDADDEEGDGNDGVDNDDDVGSTADDDDDGDSGSESQTKEEENAVDQDEPECEDEHTRDSCDENLKKRKKTSDSSESDADEGGDTISCDQKELKTGQAEPDPVSAEEEVVEITKQEPEEQPPSTHEEPQPSPPEESPPTPPENQPSSPLEEDQDDHLLHLPIILGRIHDKWYMELDEQRQFLVDGESYKLPDIKDIIKRYLRKY